MKAKEMFEKLGYKLKNEDEWEIRYSNKHFISDTEYIIFEKINKNVENFIVSDSPFTPNQPLTLNMKELQAINQQVRELGWLDE